MRYVDMKNFLALCLAVALALYLTGCISPESDYEFGDISRSVDYDVGDISRAYCAVTTPEGRNVLRGLANAAGIPSLVDYCATFGVPLAVLKVMQDDPK